MTQRIQVRRGTAAAATAADPVLAAGEFGFETDTGKVKIGDGATAWTALAYIGGASDAASVTFTPAGNIAASDVQAALAELDAEKAPATRPAAKVTRSSAYDMVNQVSTAIPWATTTFDTTGFFSAGTPTRLTVPSGLGGLYTVGADIVSSGIPAACRFLVTINKNGVAVPGTRLEQYGPGGTYSLRPAAAAATIARLSAGDYIEAVYYQNSGSTVALDVALSCLWLTRIGD